MARAWLRLARGEAPKCPRWAAPGLRAVPRSASPVSCSLIFRTGRQADHGGRARQRHRQAGTGRQAGEAGRPVHPARQAQEAPSHRREAGRPESYRVSKSIYSTVKITLFSVPFLFYFTPPTLFYVTRSTLTLQNRVPRDVGRRRACLVVHVQGASRGLARSLVFQSV